MIGIGLRLFGNLALCYLAYKLSFSLIYMICSVRLSDSLSRLMVQLFHYYAVLCYISTDNTT